MKDTIPVYDHCATHPNPIHNDINTGVIADYYPFRNKLVIPHRDSFYHVFLCNQGSGTVTIDFEKFDLQPGRIFFMTPYQVHSWDFTSDSDGYSFNFSENIFRSFITTPDYLCQFPFMRGIPDESVIDLSGDALTEAIYFFNKLIHESQKKDSFSMEQVCFHLLSLFISICRYEKLPVQKQNTGFGHRLLYNFKNMVNQHYLEKRLPKDYAAMLYITPQRLNALCNDLLGVSAGEIIRDRVLLEAKRLLVNVNMSISEIACKLDFSDNSYFTKFFKKYTSITPEEFRKRHTTRTIKDTTYAT